jgi:hypothetical protein
MRIARRFSEAGSQRHIVSRIVAVWSALERDLLRLNTAMRGFWPQTGSL